MAFERRLEAETVDEFLAAWGADERAALEKLRRDIRAAAPGVEECISYRMPAFRRDGRVLVWFRAAEKHGSFFPGAVVGRLASELRGYDTSKGTVRFPGAGAAAVGLGPQAREGSRRRERGGEGRDRASLRAPPPLTIP
jgi:uncharacterized protein YdhG (YjbR/CyaY superfamily)